MWAAKGLEGSASFDGLTHLTEMLNFLTAEMIHLTTLGQTNQS
jgi:hypothetical protein